MKLFDPIEYEQFKDIDFLGIKKNAYKIGNMGSIYSNLSQKFLSPALSNGYLTVQLAMEDGSRKTFYVHRLVGYAFIPNPNPEINVEINHKNSCREDLYYGNLEWVSKEENIKHEMANMEKEKIYRGAKHVWGDGYSTFGENNGMAKWKESEVSAMLECIQDGGTIVQALEHAGIEVGKNSIKNLWNIVKGRRWIYLSSRYVIPPTVKTY